MTRLAAPFEWFVCVVLEDARRPTVTIYRENATTIRVEVTIDGTKLAANGLTLGEALSHLHAVWEYWHQQHNGRPTG